MLRGYGLRAEHYHAGLEPDERTQGAGLVRRGSDAHGRGDDGVRHGHRQAGRSPRVPRELPLLARGVRADGGQGRPRRRAERHAAARERRRRPGAAPVRPRRRPFARRAAEPSTERFAPRRADRPGRPGRRRPRPRRSRPRRDARAGRPRLERHRSGPPVERGGALRAGRRLRARGEAARAVAARRGGACRARGLVRREQRVPPRPGGEALRRVVRHPVRSLRRLCAAGSPRDNDRRPAAAAGGHRRRRGRRRRAAGVAARQAKPRRHAARLAAGSALGPQVARLPDARRRVRRPTSAAGSGCSSPRARCGRRRRRPATACSSSTLR